MAGATLPFLFHPILRIKIHNLKSADMAWKPKVTVAAVIEQDCKVLIIEERTLLINQPFDHLEANQSLQEAEVLEESAYEVKPQYLINIFRWHAFVHGTTYLPFAGHVLAHYLERTLDADLIRSI